ncbi:PhzF family phenazine biosynthesis protein [Streptomyces sp. NPDC006134]|uniref:PhzF family phenazine biosynthesis protein n=1 Tax=Streptomyces sp. NPDC006134 TaxID=3154467 RepID=UPI0033EBFD85
MQGSRHCDGEARSARHDRPACLCDGQGGRPAAVLDEAPLSDDERRRVPVRMGTSHAVSVSVHDSRRGGPVVSLRFFTAEGELPACGHGTVAALVFLAGRAGGRNVEPPSMREGASPLVGPYGKSWSVRKNAQVNAAFAAVSVGLRRLAAAECDLVLPALGGTSGALAPGIRVASVGWSRLLVPLAARPALAPLGPDSERLRAACGRLGFLDRRACSVPTSTGRVAARRSAPSIGVAEDNANSTACPAARLAGQGIGDLAVGMGDSLGSPSTTTATAQHEVSGLLVHLGGATEVARSVRMP